MKHVRMPTSHELKGTVHKMRWGQFEESVKNSDNPDPADETLVEALLSPEELEDLRQDAEEADAYLLAQLVKDVDDN